MDITSPVDPLAEANQFADSLRRKTPPQHRWPLSKFARKFLQDHLHLRPACNQNRDRKVLALINTLWSVEVEGAAKFPNARAERAAWEAGNAWPLTPSKAHDDYIDGLVIDFLEEHAPNSYKDEYGSLNMLLRDVLGLGLAETLCRWQWRSDECAKRGVGWRANVASYAEEQHKLLSAGIEPFRI